MYIINSAYIIFKMYLNKRVDTEATISDYITVSRIIILQHAPEVSVDS